MLHLGFATGLRVSELTGLLLNAVILQPTPTISVIGKGRKQRTLPLWKQTASDIRAWLAVRGNVPTPELFVNARGESMTRVGFAYLLDKYVRIATQVCPSLDGKNVTPHVLRHTCGMMIYHATGDLRKVSLWLGHAFMQTTEMYLHADPMEKIEAIEGALAAEPQAGQVHRPGQIDRIATWQSIMKRNQSHRTLLSWGRHAYLSITINLP